MMWKVLRREGGILTATFTALASFVVLEFVYLKTLGRLVFLTGIPTLGGAPLGIHLFNVGLKGVYAALAYSVVMRLWFGRISWSRVAILWSSGLLLVAILAVADLYGFLWPAVLFWIGVISYLVISMVFVRDWVTK
jgi:hypothetical protein